MSNRPRLTVNPNRIDLDEAYMQMAEVWAGRSKANRLQVGAIIVKGLQIISDGYNGMPAGMKGQDEVCEYYEEQSDGQDGIGGPPDPIVRTKQMVLHAEANAILKIAQNGGVGAEGATLYVTYSPCPECAKLIRQAKIARVVYRNVYRLPEGIEMLEKLGVKCQQLGPKEKPKAAPVTSYPEHDWKDVSMGSGGHNGEYDHECRRCGTRDWIASYGTTADLKKGPCTPRKK